MTTKNAKAVEKLKEFMERYHRAHQNFSGVVKSELDGLHCTKLENVSEQLTTTKNYIEDQLGAVDDLICDGLEDLLEILDQGE